MWAAEAKALLDIPLGNYTIPKGRVITITRGRNEKYAIWDKGIYDLPQKYVGEIIKILSLENESSRINKKVKKLPKESPMPVFSKGDQIILNRSNIVISSTWKICVVSAKNSCYWVNGVRNGKIKRKMIMFHSQKRYNKV